MRKQERRAWICLMLVMVLLAGVGLFGYRFVKSGGEWATFYGNTQIYTDGVINRGTITDRYGEEILRCTPDGVEYYGGYETRVATVHAVGDPQGNIPDVHAFPHITGQSPAPAPEGGLVVFYC